MHTHRLKHGIKEKMEKRLRLVGERGLNFPTDGSKNKMRGARARVAAARR